MEEVNYFEVDQRARDMFNQYEYKPLFKQMYDQHTVMVHVDGFIFTINPQEKAIVSCHRIGNSTAPSQLN